MSHYSTFKTKITNRPALLKALADLGKTVVESHDAAQPLYGYQGDQRQQTAEVIIRRQQVGAASNDLGFKLQADGTYEAIISDYDKRPGRYDATWLDKLSQRYAYHVSLDTLTAQGFELAEQVNEQDGSIRLVLNHYSLG